MKIIKTSVLVFLMSLLGCSLCSAQTLEQLSYNDFTGRCEKATSAKPYLISSDRVQGPQGQTAQAKVRCWRKGDRYFASSELWIDGKKVHTTSESVLTPETDHCGVGLGEIYRPHSFSPDGKSFAFLSVPFCWFTEPWAPKVLVSDVADQKTKVLDLKPIDKELLRQNPTLKKVADNIMLDFFPSIVGWRGKDELMIEMEGIYYGADMSLRRTRWILTPKGKFVFLGEVR